MSITELLRASPVTEGLTDDQVAILAAYATETRWHRGARLVRNGDLADRSFVVLDGRLAIFVHGALTTETVEAGDLLGWSWLFPPHRWHFDAVAATDVHALELDGAALLPRLQADPELGFAWARAVLRAATLRLERARVQALDPYGQGRP